MSGFKMSQDCIIEKNVSSVVDELLKGNFVIGCDYKNNQLVLENVFHYSKTRNRYEIYTLFAHEPGKRNLMLYMAAIFANKHMPRQDIAEMVTPDINRFDAFILDKYGNLDTRKIYDKYGESMELE